MATQDDVGGVDCLFRRCSRRHRCHRDLGRRQHHQFSPADSDPGGNRRNSCLFARSAGDKNVSRNAYSHQGYIAGFRNWIFCIERIGSLARSDGLGSEREFRQANSLLHRTGSGLHRRSYLSLRPDIRVAGRRTDEIRVEKSYQFPDRPGAISFSPATDDGESDRIAATHCAPHSSNRPDPTQAEQRRTPAHSSVRGKTNAQVTGRAADSTRKAVGHFEEDGQITCRCARRR